MAKTFLALLMATLSIAAAADETPAPIALLVNEPNAEAVAARLGPALAAKEAVTRAAAARVALVRGLTGLLPQIRDALTIESDSSAAREEVRALVILGDPSDVDRARNATRKLAPAIDDVIARAVSRRPDAFDIYVNVLRGNGFVPDANFFTQALWRRQATAVAAGSRLLGMHDAAGWSALLAALSEAHLAMQPGVLGASLNASSEEIRTASVWYLIRSYLPYPSLIPESIRAILAAPKEEASTREEFGRELLHRMLGAEKKVDRRWLDWLQSSEADPLVGTDEAILQYFTDKEFLARKNHCGVASYDCRMPSKRPGRMIRSTNVAEPAYFLPEVLPPGLADAVFTESRCNGWWLATAGAASDIAGRVQSVALKRVQMDSACEKAVTTLMRLSFAMPGSMDAPLTTSDILLVHALKQPPCLDEAPLEASIAVTAQRVGGEVTAPIAKHRQEPQFPASARRAMGGSSGVIIVLRAVISHDGCVRAAQLIRQSPFPELNAAGLFAISQWTFEPGRLRGIPVDVVFDLTISFRTN